MASFRVLIFGLSVPVALCHAGFCDSVVDENDVSLLQGEYGVSLLQVRAESILNTAEYVSSGAVSVAEIRPEDSEDVSLLSWHGLPLPQDPAYTDVIQSLSLNYLKELELDAKDLEWNEHAQENRTDKELDTVSRETLRIAHLVSLMPDPGAEELAVLESMVAAKYESERKHPGLLHIELIGVQMVGEKLYDLPKAFKLARPMDDNTASRWGCKKALPFAAHMLRTLQSEAPHAEVYIQTNADVGVMPEFYADVAKEYRLKGHDGLNILKVVIPATCDGRDVARDLPKAYELARELPQMHPGSETFVWAASHTDEMIRSLGSVFLGYGPIGAEMNRAVQLHSANFSMVQGEHWVFHIGAEGENGRGDPGLLGAYMKQVEAERPGCKFTTARRAPQQHEDKSCPYQVLNLKASDAAIIRRRLGGAVHKAIVNATHTWQEFHDIAFERSGTLPTRQQLVQANVSAPEAEVWLPVRRVDGKTDDWVRIGANFTQFQSRFQSHYHIFDKSPPWSRNHNLAQKRPMYFFIFVAHTGDPIEE